MRHLIKHQSSYGCGGGSLSGFARARSNLPAGGLTKGVGKAEYSSQNIMDGYTKNLKY